MAELADAMDLGSIGNPVQVRPLLSAPSVSVYKSFLQTDIFIYNHENIEKIPITCYNYTKTNRNLAEH